MSHGTMRRDLRDTSRLIAVGIDGTRGGEKDMEAGEGRDQKDPAGGKDGIEGDGQDSGGEGRDRKSGGEASAVQKSRKFEEVRGCLTTQVSI